MRKTAFLLILVASVSVTGQSRRAAQTAPPTAAETPSGAANELTVKQMFEEANTYTKTKIAEFEQKKIPYSDALFLQTQRERKQLAAKYATISGNRQNPTGEDSYFLGLLHLIAENQDGALDNLKKFLASDNPAVEKVQTARSHMVDIYGKRKNFDEAERFLVQYLKSNPIKLTERSRMERSLAKAYQEQKDYIRMAPHADEGYTASKALLADATSRARGLDEILDAGMLLYEAHRDAGNREKAEAALDDMKATAASTGSSSFYYYAVDQKVKYLIETGRKPAALMYYETSLASAEKDFVVKNLQDDVKLRLRKREKHYKLLGDPPPELPLAVEWYPGRARSFVSMKGKVVLLDFWATWCTPCFEAFPSLIEWHQDFKADGFEILGITRYYGEANGMPADNVSELNFLKNFRIRERLPYDIVVGGTDQAMQHMYGATFLPTAVLIDRKGIVRYVESGTSPTRIEQMRQMLLKLLAEK